MGIGRAKIASDHRDERNQLAPEKPSTGNKRRNTRKWCKGKPGVEHQYEKFTKVWNMGWAEFNLTFSKCKACGREKWN